MRCAGAKTTRTPFNFCSMAQTINPKYADIKRREKENLAAITAKYEAAKANMLKDDIARIISDAEYNYRIAKTEVDLTKYDLNRVKRVFEQLQEKIDKLTARVAELEAASK